MQKAIHNNNFGFLRLLLATLVIVSHSSEIVDGNRSRELLSSLIGHRSFGDLAVDGFFLISGFLIVKSFVQSPSIFGYLLKRIGRIYPGYLTAYLICVLLLAPLTGVALAKLSINEFFHVALNGFGLQGPPIPGFIGLKYPSLNGSMWTISSEFRCYILVLLLGIVGIFTTRWLFLTLTALVLAAVLIQFDPQLSPRMMFFTGEIGTQIRLTGAFCVGSCFYLFRDRISFRWEIAAVCAVGLLFSMYFGLAEEVAFAILGGYILFWFALSVKSKNLSQINSEDDISYGVYLYAWPISSLLVYFLDINSPWLLFTLTVPLAYSAGWLSWRLVEKPFARPSPLFRSRERSGTGNAA